MKFKRKNNIGLQKRRAAYKRINETSTDKQSEKPREDNVVQDNRKRRQRYQLKLLKGTRKNSTETAAKNTKQLDNGKRATASRFQSETGEKPKKNLKIQAKH